MMKDGLCVYFSECVGAGVSLGVLGAFGGSSPRLYEGCHEFLANTQPLHDSSGMRRPLTAHYSLYSPLQQL